jgi:hypothetical protein
VQILFYFFEEYMVGILILDEIDDLDHVYKEILNSKFACIYLSVEYLKGMMSKNHFFLFPTASLCEGHSNSLNESMSQGLIPIVSNHHFNKSIVRDERLVVDGYNPEDYASKIRYIIDKCDLGQLSRQMIQIVKDNYVYENIIGRISREIKSV